MTDMVVKIMEENPGEHAEACTALESLFKDLGESPFAIKVGAEILHHEDRTVLPALQTIFHLSSPKKDLAKPSLLIQLNIYKTQLL